MFLEKGVCSIWKNVSYIAATILPVLAERDRVSYLLSALCMFLLQRGKEPGSFRFLFLHGDRQRRSFGAEFPDLYRFCLKRRDPRIGYPDHFRRHRVVRNLHLAADQGRCRLIFPALEADTCSLSTSRVRGGEMLPPLRWYQGMSGDGCPFPIPASVRSPGREQGCPGFRNTHGSLHGASCDNTLPGKIPQYWFSCSSVRI